MLGCKGLTLVSDQDQIFPYNIKQYQERTMLFLFLMSWLNEEAQESYLTHLGFETTEFQKALNSGQFTLSTQLIILNYPVILSH